ncbi:transcriptional regulator LeuO [Serratia sp. M24T3]|uniref:transcriptional regulator LeuO n=1 Tax=Serratia sp. M24T3 TaxID=932213 RepID=UPI0002F0A5B9|nr:transcriptional regulator LeuO [Serratia sp. M24T3]
MTDIILDKTQSKRIPDNKVQVSHEDNHLRRADLNLLTVFDAVMQLQNITRAARMLGMSQPAVSNAVSRLKNMFSDELFVRSGRGIEPTARAHQLYGPIRQALQLVTNELPGLCFDPQTSRRQFAITISSPLDLLLAPKILGVLKQHSRSVTLNIGSLISDNIENQLRYQELEFVIDYRSIDRADYYNQKLFEDELVLISSNNHPRIQQQASQSYYFKEKHAVVRLNGPSSFSFPYYNKPETHKRVCYQGASLFSVMEIVSQTEMIAVVPKWLAQQSAERLNLKIDRLPWINNKITSYLSWHESASKDKGHLWMKELLTQNVSLP